MVLTDPTPAGETYDPNAPLPDWVRRAARSCADPVAVARALRPVLEAGAAESERLGRLCDASAKALCASGLFGMVLPVEFGGMECDPVTMIEVLEEVSSADGSAGWVLVATTFCIAGAASWLGPAAIDAMFHRDNGYLCAGQIAKNGVAEQVDGGWRVRGRFHFGSGAQLASWFLGAFRLHEHGSPVFDERGEPRIVWFYAPRSQVELDPASWDVAGLRATASYDFTFVDQVLHDDFVMIPPRRTRRGGPAMDLGVSLGHVAFSLGVGRRILDEVQALAAGKRREGRTTLIDQPTFQRDFGMHRAAVDAARSHIRAVYADWYDDARRNGTAGTATRAAARLAACWGTKVATDAGQWAYLAAGTDGLRTDAHGVLQRCHRDLQASAVHRHVDDNVLVEAAGVLLGAPAPGVQL
jgi:alkylation response protein AidB-like acyl-CoA dehydrogenase